MGWNPRGYQCIGYHMQQHTQIVWGKVAYVKIVRATLVSARHYPVTRSLRRFEKRCPLHS